MSPDETRADRLHPAAVAEDLRIGRYTYVRTRLPPEPNGYLHIGHVKAFMIDYLIARENGGELILRFDDTNPAKEETEYVDAIKDDARWLGIQWVKETYASDYFGLLYEWAVSLVKSRPRLRGRPDRRAGQRQPRHPDRARQELALPRPRRRREP